MGACPPTVDRKAQCVFAGAVHVQGAEQPVTRGKHPDVEAADIQMACGQDAGSALQ